MRTLKIIIVIGLCALSCHSWALREGVNPEKEQALKEAAPLNHTVKVSRTGRVLKLDYELIGADKKKYSLWDIHDRSKPAFTIYQDGIEVNRGDFEYG